MTKKPDLDEPTRRIAERMLNMPPKPHKEMKVGKRKAKARPPEKGDHGKKALNDVWQNVD